MPELEFPHVTGARFNDAGEKVADGLLEFVGIYYPGYTPHDLQRYFNRGTFIDRACNLLAQGKELHPETEAKAAAENWTGYLRAYSAFLSQHTFLIHRWDWHVVNEIERYQGSYDQKGILDGRLTRLDLKTGHCPKFTGLQLAFYDLADGKTQRMGLELHDDGTYKLIPFKDFRDYDKARLIVRAYWTTREYL